MAIHKIDGYSHYSTAQLSRQFVRTNGTPTIVAGGRNGGNRLQCDTGASVPSSDYVALAIPPSPQSLAWGHYITLTSLATRIFLYNLRDATVSHLTIAVNADGSLAVFRPGYDADFGGNYQGNPNVDVTQLGVTAPGLVHVDEPFAFKAFATVDDAAGVVQLYVNGALVLDLSGQDTRRGGTATITNVLYGCVSYGGYTATAYFEDFWCGSAMLPGDRRVDAHFPIADGANTDFTPSSGADHFEMVNEATADDDTTKVTATPVDSRDTYKVESFKNPGGTIDAVQIVLTAKKVDANSAELAACIRSNGANHDGAAQGLTTDWNHLSEVFETDPGTTAGWAEGAFGAGGTAEFGQHKAA